MPQGEPDRLTRLEEAVLFAERRLDELHGEIHSLGARLDRLAVRVEALHTALEARQDAGPEPDSDEQPGSDA